jgi:hypothetical protein
MGLADVYQDAMQKHYQYPKGWMANWPPGYEQRLGVVGTISRGMLNYEAMLSDEGVIALEDPDHGTSAGAWNFQSSQGIKADVGVDASTPGWEWIGNAKAGVQVAFGSNEGIVLGVGETHFERFRNIDEVKSSLLKAYQAGKLSLGQAVVVERHVADKGLLVVSHGSNGTFKGTASADITPGGTPPLASFAADLGVESSSEDLSVQQFPHGFTIAFRVAKIATSGFWWWTHVVVKDEARLVLDESSIWDRELVRTDPDESTLSADDYFLRFS